VIHRPEIGELNGYQATIAHCREVLGEHGKGKSDEEIYELYRQAWAIAPLLLAMFRAQSLPSDTP
jgi:hypothetical protein